MKRKRILWVLAIVFAIALVGCKKAEPAPVADSFTGMPRGLDGVNGLALGTLELEGTEEALTPAQAADLLPLWQMVQGGSLQGDAETRAVLKQIEGKMSESQLAAIEAMELTFADMQAWMQEQGIEMPARPGDGRQGAPGAFQNTSEDERARMRREFQNTSSEQRATRMAEMGIQRPEGEGQGGAPGAGPNRGDASEGLTRAVIALLAERSGQAVARNARPTATITPWPRRTRPGPTASPTSEPTPTAAQTAEETSAPETTPAPTSVATAAATQTPTPATMRTKVPASGDVATPVPALAQVEDTDPGPPFTVEVSLNRVTQDPLVEQSQMHEITGLVRNDGDRTYAVSAIHVTFFDAEGFRGSYYRFPGRGPASAGGEWIWHGQTEADFSCLLLAAGETCPFNIEITAQDMASFLIHPDAVATDRVSAPVELSVVRLVDEGTDYLRISGTATNGNTFKVKNVTVSGVLLDANGQIVSVGSTYVLREDIAPGTSVSFDVRVEKQPYVSYQLYAQAERDWE